MQIKDNITATINPSVNAKEVKPQLPIKMAKLRSIEMFSKNSNKLMEPTWEVKKEEVSNVAPAPETQVETPVATETKVEKKTKEPKQEATDVAPLPLTSEEVIRSKKDLLGIEAYKDIESNVVDLASYQNARRLRVNEVVVGNANRERNINGGERIKEKIKEEKPENKPFDFSSLGGMDETVGNNLETKVEENVPGYDNNTKLDEWLNKETAPSMNSDDKVLNEVNELQANLNDNTSSLATQKEILETLRARIANNEALCRAKKQELEEENMNVTRELNDVLAEITKLTSLANQQEAFLGISNDDESYGKSRAA